MAGIGKEISFGLDNFQQQKILSDNESIAQLLLNLFMMKPGNLPGLPHIGINIQSYLYKFQEDLDPDEIKEKIYNQSSALIPYINLGEVKIFIANYKGQDILMIAIPVISQTTIVFGFTKNQTGNILFNYDFQNDNLTII